MSEFELPNFQAPTFHCVQERWRLQTPIAQLAWPRKQNIWKTGSHFLSTYLWHLFEWFRIWVHPSVPASPCYALHRGTDDQWAAVSSSADQRIAPGAPVGFYLRGSQSYNIYNAIHLQFQCCVWTGLQAQAWDSCSSATRVKGTK